MGQAGERRARNSGAEAWFFICHAARAIPKALLLSKSAGDEASGWWNVLRAIWILVETSALWLSFKAKHPDDFATLGDSLTAYAPKAVLAIAMIAYVKAFLDGIWDEIQRERGHSGSLAVQVEDQGRLIRKTGALVSAEQFTCSVRRDYEPVSGGLTGPVLGYWIQVVPRVINGMEPRELAFKLILTRPNGSHVEVLLSMYSGQVGQGRMKSFAFAAHNPAVAVRLDGLIENKSATKDEADALSKCVAHLVVTDCRRRERWKSIRIPGEEEV